MPWLEHTPLESAPKADGLPLALSILPTGQGGIEQSTPVQPGSHSQPLAVHSPWPEQLCRHAASAQLGPEKPTSHTHAPSAPQWPFGQPHCSSVQLGLGTSQLAPVQAAWHTQLPPMHSPWPQSPSQPGDVQAGPDHPGKHWHLPSTQSPWPAQPAGHEAMWQSNDSHPSSHSQTLCTQRPCCEQLFGQAR